MRKNLNKLIAFSIGLSVMSGSVIPAFAADTQTNVESTKNVQANSVKPLLTREDAIQAAIDSSDTIQLDNSKISYQDTINNTNEDIEDYNDIDDDLKDFNDDTRDLTINQLKQKREFDKDKITQQTIEAYNNIVTSQMTIDNAQSSLEVQTKLLNDSKLQNSLGIITNKDLTSVQLQIEQLNSQLKTSQNELNDAIASFKTLTGKDVNNFTLEQDIDFEPFKIDGTVDKYLDDVIDKYLKYSEDLIKLNKDYYNDKDNVISTSSGTFEIKELSNSKISDLKKEADNLTKPTLSVDDTTTVKQYADAYATYQSELNEYTKKQSAYVTALAGRLAYLNTKLGMSENEINLNAAKKSYKDSLRTVYTNLLSVEDNINIMKKNIELKNKELSDAKLKYDLGLITKSDYDTLVVSNKSLEIQLRSTIENYNTLKEEIQKPWILLS